MIKPWLQSIKKEINQNEPERHTGKLGEIAGYILDEHASGRKANLVFICTHNSRRSQFTQTFCDLSQAFLGLEVANAYSGGTEVTECNPRTTAALRRIGLSVEKSGNQNPVYTLSDDELLFETKLWSKLYDDKSNPEDRFAAIMTCSHADANCPFIPGAARRIPLTYTDPKHADDTETETKAYDETCKMIATDIMRLFLKVREELD